MTGVVGVGRTTIRFAYSSKFIQSVYLTIKHCGIDQDYLMSKVVSGSEGRSFHSFLEKQGMFLKLHFQDTSYQIIYNCAPISSRLKCIII